MAPPNRALFDVDDDGSDAGFIADPGQVVTFKLRNPNVRSWELQVWDPNAYDAYASDPIRGNPPRKSKNAPDVSLVGSTTGKIVSPVRVDQTITLTLPTVGNGINSYLIRSIVNGGMVRGVVDANLLFERLVATAPSGLRKPVVTELLQFEMDSWAGPVCDIIDWLNANGGGTGTGLPAGANGDILINVAGTWVRLGGGAADTVLTMLNTGVPAWRVVPDELAAGTAGAILRWDTGTSAWVPVAIGSANQVLTVIGGQPTWATFAGGSGGSGVPLPTPTKGDVLTGDGSSWFGTSLGTIGQVFTVGSGGLPIWAAAPAGGSGGLPAGAKGDILRHEGGSGFVPYGAGATGTQLTIGSGGLPEWQADEIWVGAEGDIVTYKGGSWTLLPIGAANFVLTSVAGYPAWAAGGSGGSGVSVTSAGSRQAVRVATAANLPTYTRTGNVLTASANGALPQIDGVTLSVSDRLLLLEGNALSAAHAGIYIVTSLGGAGAPWVLTRSTDMDTSGEVEPGVHFWVLAGTANGERLAVLVAPTTGAVVINTTALDFELFDIAGGGGSFPGGAKGDVYVHDGTDVDVVNIGTSGQFFRVGGTSMPVWDTVPLSDIIPGVAKGDTLYFDTNWLIRSIGAPDQIWTVDGGVPQWRDPPIGLPATAQKGDMLFYDGSIWNRRAIGNSGDHMVVVGGLPVWAADGSGSGGGGTLLPTPDDGDILRGVGGEWTNYGIGASGYVLTSDGTEPSWQPPPALGATLNKIVRIAVDTNITLAGLQTLQGVTLVNGDRVLTAGQTTASGNGVWIAAVPGWTRATDFDDAVEAGRAVVLHVQEGTHHDSLWIHKTAITPIVVGTTALSFERLTPPQAEQFGSVLVKYGPNEFGWVSGTDGTVLTISNNEPVFLEPQASDVVDPLEAAEVVIVDLAFQMLYFPGPLTVDSGTHTITASFNAVFRSNLLGSTPGVIDGVTLVPGIRMLVFTDEAGGGAPWGLNGVWEFLSIGSSTNPWQLRRVAELDTGAEIERNVIVRALRGTVFGGSLFANRTRDYPVSALDSAHDLSWEPIASSSSGPGGPSTIEAASVVWADGVWSGEIGISWFATATESNGGNTLTSTSTNAAMTADSGAAVSVGERVLIALPFGNSLARRNGVWLVTQTGNSQTTIMVRVPEMDSTAKFLAVRAVIIISGGGIGGDDDFYRIWINTTDPRDFVALGTSSSSWAHNAEESRSVVVTANVAISAAELGSIVRTDGIGQLRSASPVVFPTIDGVSPFSGMRVLVHAGDALSQVVGVYVLDTVGGGSLNWQLTRVVELDTSEKATLSQIIVVNNGSTGPHLYVKTWNGPIALFSTSWNYLKLGGASGASGGFLKAYAAVLYTDVPSHSGSGTNTIVATANGQFAGLDGVTPQSTMRILIYGNSVISGVWQFTQPGNASTPWILTRADELNTTLELDTHLGVTVQAGTLNGGAIFTPIFASGALNAVAREWRRVGGGASSLDPGTLHGAPIAWNTNTGDWAQFEGGIFPALRLWSITSTTAERGLWIGQVHNAAAARVVLDRQAASGETAGDISEIVTRALLDHAGTDAFEDVGIISTRIETLGGSDFVPGGSFDRVTSLRFQSGAYTHGAAENYAYGTVFKVGPGKAIIERPAAILAAIGQRYDLQFKQSSTPLGGLFAEVRTVNSGVPSRMRLGVDVQVATGSVVNAGLHEVLVVTTTTGTQGVMASIAVAANQTIEFNYILRGRLSTGAQVLLVRGTYSCYRLNTGNTVEIEKIQKYFSTTTDWGDTTEVGCFLSTNNIDFRVQGAASQTVEWRLDVSWVPQ